VVLERATVILITEFMHATGLKILEETGVEFRYEPDLWKDAGQLQRLVSDAEALIVRNQTQVNASLLGSTPALRVVGRLGAGLDNIDQEALQARKVHLVRARTENAAAVAEYVMAALLLLARRLDTAAAHVAQGGWQRGRFGGFELRDKTLGIVGFGDIGFRVARRAQAFGMRVLASDPARLGGDAILEEHGIALVDLTNLLKRSDFVSLHAPLTPHTHHLIDRERLAQMPSGSYVINAARGALIECQALADALESGHLAGAVLDVVEPEPLPADHPLRDVPNLWVTPHVAGLTMEAQARVTQNVIRGVLEALKKAGHAVLN
jgi:D-3-phosphoglycerate dehydrogenase